MKKTIFDLKYSDGIKLDKELKKTSYFQQYFASVCLSVWILCVGGIVSITNCIETGADITIPVVLLAGFASLIVLLFRFKRFDLIKEYYNSKNDK